MSFDGGNRDVTRHNVAWKNRLNAANFAANVADVCLTDLAAQEPVPVDLVMDLEFVQQVLTVARQIPILGTVYSRMSDPAIQQHWRQIVLPAYTQLSRWQKTVADDGDSEIDAFASLIGTVFDLYLRDDKSPTSIANEAGRWVYTRALATNAITEAAIEQLEIQYRIADRITPPSDNCRHAFEAVWALGKFRDAIKLLHRKER